MIFTLTVHMLYDWLMTHEEILVIVLKGIKLFNLINNLFTPPLSCFSISNITRDRKNRKLTLSQGEYTKKVLERFGMQNAKPVSTPLASHLKLTKEMYPKTRKEI